MTCKSTGFSPFYMAHGIKPILPFNTTLATFLVPDLIKPLSMDKLIVTHTHQLKKCQNDLTTIHDCILNSQHASVCQFEQQYGNTIQCPNFKPGDLILVRNSGLDTEISHKMKP
jgi:hypothetical protein